MKEEEIVDKIRKKFGDKVEVSIKRNRRIIVKIDRDMILDVSKFLFEELDFKFFSTITAVDFPDRFECIYHISREDGIMILLKAKIPKNDPKIKSVVSIWPGANWHEREAYDLMGIVFEGHPDLRRIFLPEDFEGHPLRKDFKLKEASWF